MYPGNENLKNNGAQKSQANPFVSKLEFLLREMSSNNLLIELFAKMEAERTLAFTFHCYCLCQF